MFSLNRSVGVRRKRYDPEKFPLKLTLVFSKKQTGLKDYIKDHVRDIPKSAIRYSFGGRYTQEVDIYSKNVSSLIPVFNALGHTQIEMWDRKALAPDERIFPCNLYDQGQHLILTRE